MNKAEIEHYPLGLTQGVPFTQLSLLSRLGLVSILGLHSPLGSPATALTALGCHCVETGLFWNEAFSPSGSYVLKTWMSCLSCPQIP